MSTFRLPPLDLDAVQGRYAAWHGADNDAPGGARFWPDGDPDESMSHYIVRNDVPDLIAAVKTYERAYGPVPRRTQEES